MAEKPVEGKKRQTLLQRLTNKYRLVILNDETFEEVTSFRLSRINVYILLSTITVLTVLVTASAIIYTPLKEYIPGYSDVSLRRELIDQTVRTDSLQKVLHAGNVYAENLLSILRGEIPTDRIDSAMQVPEVNYDTVNLAKISPTEEKFRDQVEEEQQFSISAVGTISEPGKQPTLKGFYFFTPIKGYITEKFDAKEKHYGIDIVSPENEPIKSTLDGIVVFAGWMVETGYVIGIQHSNNLISLYKHNSVLLKSEGDYVRAGDVIAIVGNTGELTTGPHLHFELWFNGIPLNPEEYIALN